MESLLFFFFSSAQDQPQGLAHAGRFLTTELPSVTSNIFFINTVLTSKGVNILSKLTEVFYSLSLLELNLADEQQCKNLYKIITLTSKYRTHCKSKFLSSLFYEETTHITIYTFSGENPTEKGIRPHFPGQSQLRLTTESSSVQLGY